jgi:ribosome-associated toxin RatA of RatAB toxin-antitoxin module
MIRIDERMTAAGPDAVFRVAADVERWPEVVPHYRWVRFHIRDGFGRGIVEMAAWREFRGPLRYPTWWKSSMEADPKTPIVRYHHIGGITRGMDVRWEFEPRGEGTLVRIVHEWSGPPWPIIGRFAADRVIGPHFVSVIAGRTLAAICAEAERHVAATRMGTAPVARTGDSA